MHGSDKGAGTKKLAGKVYFAIKSVNNTGIKKWEKIEN